MLRLENETDPKRRQPKHLRGKKIIYRVGNGMFLSEVIIIGTECYVQYNGTWKEITKMDGWVEIPVVSYL